MEVTSNSTNLPAPTPVPTPTSTPVVQMNQIAVIKVQPLKNDKWLYEPSEIYMIRSDSRKKSIQQLHSKLQKEK
jgi:hypothetical protein